VLLLLLLVLLLGVGQLGEQLSQLLAGEASHVISSRCSPARPAGLLLLLLLLLLLEVS
jgi:hypothetical protein